VQAQIRQFLLQPRKSRNDPARQDAGRASQHQCAAALLLPHAATGVAQPYEGVAGGFGQMQAGAGRHQTAAFAPEQRAAQCFFQRAQMATDRAVGDVQLVGGAADAVQSRDRLKGPQRVQRGQGSRHNL
jgi:hypothetical protein